MWCVRFTECVCGIYGVGIRAILFLKYNIQKTTQKKCSTYNRKVYIYIDLVDFSEMWTVPWLKRFVAKRSGSLRDISFSRIAEPLLYTEWGWKLIQVNVQIIFMFRISLFALYHTHTHTTRPSYMQHTWKVIFCQDLVSTVYCCVVPNAILILSLAQLLCLYLLWRAHSNAFY